MGKRHHSYCNFWVEKAMILDYFLIKKDESGEIHPKNRSYILESGGEDKADNCLIK